MNDFFRTEDQGSGKSDHFQAKFLTHTKVKCSDETYSTGFIFYRYQIVIAPITNKPIHIKNIHFSLSSDNLMNYFENYQIGDRKGIFSATVQIGELTSDAFQSWSDEKDMIANEFDFYVNNMGDDQQEKAKITEYDFDEGMTALKIKIYYNNTSETIILKYTGELISVSNIDDPLAKVRKDIYDLVNKGRTNSYYGSV